MVEEAEFSSYQQCRSTYYFYRAPQTETNNAAPDLFNWRHTIKHAFDARPRVLGGWLESHGTVI